MNENNSIYIISGPCGVGKSTTTKELVNALDNTVLIEGDVVHGMFMEKDNPCWEKRLEITWWNILSLTRNFVQNNLNVIIDYVVEDELEWFCQSILDFDVKIKYIVLVAEPETIISRLKSRGDKDLIDRSLFLLDELTNKDINKTHLFDVGNLRPSDIVAEILENRKFLMDY